MSAETETFNELKRCAARYVYRRRDQYIMHKEPGERYRKKISWRQWWTMKFGEDYGTYVKAESEKARNRLDQDQRRQTTSSR